MIYKRNNQSAEIIADSIGPNGKRITTLRIYQNRFCHAELLRHRLFSFSVASSRAIPYPTQRKQVEENPVMPIMWQKSHKGMQGFDCYTDQVTLDHKWLSARDYALATADFLEKLEVDENGKDVGVTKQLLNRLIEPWVSTRCIVTATEWDNFFLLRKPPAKKKYRISKEQLAKLKN